MTEYSKNSRNMKAETVSNTGGNSGQGPTHPYSQHSQSPSHYSHERSMHSDVPESPEDNIELGIQYIMPLVNAIKQQNEHLKSQREQIQAEMQQLSRLSQDLLSQNQQLRRHHSLRTQDIKKLIQTISINTHEETTDINHQSFLLKQSNHALVKQIQTYMRASAEVNAQISASSQEMDSIYRQSHMDQQAIRELQIKNKQLFYRCEELKRQVEGFNAAIENDAVHEALVEVVALKNKNKQDVLKARNLLFQHKEEKPFVQENHASVAMQNKQLKNQQQELKETARSADRKLEQLKITYGQSVEKFAESFRNYERAKNSLNENEETLVKIKQAITESKAKSKKIEPTIAQLGQEKQDLRQKILAKKQNIAKAQDERLEVQEKLGKELKTQINKLKDQTNKNTAKITEEITKKITPEATTVANAIAQSKEEYAELVQEVQELEESMRKLQNPRKEIIRLEYQLKKLSNKKN